MKLTNTIVGLALTCGVAWAQNGPVIVQGAKAKADAAQQAQHSAAKVVSAAMPQASKPAAVTKVAPAAATKAPVAKPVPAAVAKTQVTKPASAAAGKTIAAKPAAQPVKVSGSQAKPSAVPVSKAAAAKPKAPAVKPAAHVSVKAAPTATPAKKAQAKEIKAKAEASKPAASKPAAENPEKREDVSVDKTPEAEKSEKSTRTITANGRRDPFVSPVISQSAVGSGCSSGKRCLAVDQISLKGVVRSETGMIAVVVNALDKAYFLRENDPVFDGYVLKITGDSIVFKETMQDKLGKPFTKEVTKKISAPSV
jgi:Tfp pilus assembly protein PilP